MISSSNLKNANCCGKPCVSAVCEYEARKGVPIDLARLCALGNLGITWGEPGVERRGHVVSRLDTERLSR